MSLNAPLTFGCNDDNDEDDDDHYYCFQDDDDDYDDYCFDDDDDLIPMCRLTIRSLLAAIMMMISYNKRLLFAINVIIVKIC